jgi:hypothetical protein
VQPKPVSASPPAQVPAPPNQPLSDSASARPAAETAPPPPKAKELPNLWLKPVLERQPIRYEWLTSLVYEGIAVWARNSSEGKLLDCACWFISLSDAEDLHDPAFRGVFLTEKGGFGLMSGGYMIRLEQGTAFVGTPNSELKDSDVRLDGVGIDSDGRLVLIVNDGYRSKFGVPEAMVTATLEELKEHGAELMSIKEVLESPDPLDIVWTAPAEQANAGEPKALASRRPGFTL